MTIEVNEEEKRILLEALDTWIYSLVRHNWDIVNTKKAIKIARELSVKIHNESQTKEKTEEETV